MSFDITVLHAILCATTTPLRKGEVVHGTPELVEAVKRGDEKLPGCVVTIDAMPHEQTPAAEALVKVDCHFLVIGVNKATAEDFKPKLIEILRAYPGGRLAAGPSYIEVGAEIGDQTAAFRLFGLGKVLGLWDVITPKTLGATGEQADRLAGMGYVMITGFSE